MVNTKKILAAALAVVMLLALAACAGKNGAEEPFADAVFNGDVKSGLADDAPDSVREAVIGLRSNAPASHFGADGTPYSGQREFAWTVADYLAGEGGKALGQWVNGKYAAIDGTVVTYREQGENALTAVIDYAVPSLTYVSRNGSVVYYNSMTPDLFEECADDGAMATGVAVTDVARGFSYNREKDMLLNWVTDANGYRYSTGEADYLISDTTTETDGSPRQIFYVYTSKTDGGYQVKASCAYLEGITALNTYDVHISNSEIGELDATYVALAGKDGKELYWKDGETPVSYGSCYFMALTEGYGWLTDATDADVRKLDMIAIGDGTVADALRDYTGLIGSVGITFAKADPEAYYGSRVSLLGSEIGDAAAVDALTAAVEAKLG